MKEVNSKSQQVDLTTSLIQSCSNRFCLIWNWLDIKMVSLRSCLIKELWLQEASEGGNITFCVFWKDRALGNARAVCPQMSTVRQLFERLYWQISTLFVLIFKLSPTGNSPFGSRPRKRASAAKPGHRFRQEPSSWLHTYILIFRLGIRERLRDRATRRAGLLGIVSYVAAIQGKSVQDLAKEPELDTLFWM